ncbi:MAG TPA: bi-domain-containing oxidoreductase [Rhodanobacteraceae bacterium]|nr:bi-domain-containing oxidoreductase [Rhodanobacteraceae bacterium]
MKQILQSLKDGRTELAEVPAPRPGRGQVLIRTTTSLVSAGTERMLVEFGKANWLDKARQQPDKVRMVLDKIRTDGLAPTLAAVRSKLDQPLAPGYCNVGVVAELGEGVEGFAIGERVASNGKHAEFACVPKNLCARIPDPVGDEAAAFTVLGAIGLQGIRLANPTLGECVVVTGLGLIGLLTVQMLRAQGCRVLGIDPDPARRALAETFGADTAASGDGDAVLAAALAFSRGRGVDAVLITASTKSSEPVHQAAQMCRQRGRIVLVGVTGLELSRADFYAKELSFQVSCSYGPGRYDPAYEDAGQDYPLGFVRWTEQRNFEAVLDLLAAGKLDTAPLVSHRFELDRAVDAYALLASSEASLGIVLEYPGAAIAAAAAPTEASFDDASAFRRSGGSRDRMPRSAISIAPSGTAAPRVAFLGAGNYAGRILIPAFKSAGATLDTIVSASGVSAAHHAKKHGFARAASDASAAVADANVDAVVIATRHNLHAREVLASLRAGKHVFCEKPLCLTLEELAAIEQFFVGAESAPMLMVGFNRRFAPQVRKMKALLDGVKAPASFIMTVNAGAIPADSWIQDPAIGGGRLIGEGCHFIDLLRHLADAPIVGFDVAALGETGGPPRSDNFTLTLRFANGSIGSIHYLANGNKSFPKERLEVFTAGRVLQLDNFRSLRGWGWAGFKRQKLWRQDKGQNACAAAFVNALREGRAAPIPLDEILETSRIAIEAAKRL